VNSIARKILYFRAAVSPSGMTLPAHQKTFLQSGRFLQIKSIVMHDGDKLRHSRIPVWIYLAVASIGLAIAAVLNIFCAQLPV
jgi:hypothetical protein